MKPLAFLLLIFIICLNLSASAQTKPAATQIPDELMKAEFTSVRDSAPIILGADKSSVLVVALWASWCGPCRFAITALNGAKGDFEFRGVKVVGLTVEDPAKHSKEVHSFLDENRVAFPVAWLDPEHAKALMGGRDAIPQLLVLAGDGTVAKRFVGWNQEYTMSQLRLAVDEALTKAEPK